MKREAGTQKVENTLENGRKMLVILSVISHLGVIVIY